jgi:hypothetical protein
MDEPGTLELLCDLNDSILPSQYNDLVRGRPSALPGEHRLLWAVLEMAVRSYVANVSRSTVNQRREFAEVRSWFLAEPDPTQGLFAFRTICEFLDIDSGRLVRGLELISAGKLPKRLHRTWISRPSRRRRLAA